MAALFYVCKGWQGISGHSVVLRIENTGVCMGLLWILLVVMLTIVVILWPLSRPLLNKGLVWNVSTGWVKHLLGMLYGDRHHHVYTLDQKSFLAI
jgi:hypothetical protein